MKNEIITYCFRKRQREEEMIECFNLIGTEGEKDVDMF